MHFAVVAQGIPNPKTSGSLMANWTVIKSARETGHRVSCVLIKSSRDNVSPDHIRALHDMGVEVTLLEGNSEEESGRANKPWQALLQTIRVALPLTLRDLFPVLSLTQQIVNVLAQLQPDAIYVFDLGQIAALKNLRIAPRMAVLGDPMHLVRLYALVNSKPQISLSYAIRCLNTFSLFLILPRMIVRLVTGYESVGWLGAQHAAWLCKKGVDCKYIRLPVIDMAGPDLGKLRQTHLSQTKPKILVFGHHLATAGAKGIRVLAEEILPVLEQALGPNGFELHIIEGRYNFPLEVRQKLAQPAVRWRGYVEDITDELLSSHVVLMPVSYPIGIRAGIITAFSFGCCVVSDPSSVLGLPELIHKKNGLVASTGQGLAHAIIQVINDPALRKQLGKNARLTYEQHFTPKVAGAQIVAELERIARENKKP